MGRLSAGWALVIGAVAAASRLGVAVARRWLPGVLVLAVMVGAALAIVAASALLWRVRLRRLTRVVADRPAEQRPPGTLVRAS
jgi:hypothetical protein